MTPSKEDLLKYISTEKLVEDCQHRGITTQRFEHPDGTITFEVKFKWHRHATEPYKHPKIYSTEDRRSDVLRDVLLHWLPILGVEYQLNLQSVSQ